jgi:O-antigen/teichoic acid export membrane protein
MKNPFKNSLVAGGVIFLVGGVVANLLNYVYRIVMGRMLGPEIFGELIALISLTLILAVPSAPVQTAAARFSAVLEAKDSSRKIKNLFSYLTRVFGLISLVLIILAVVFAGIIQKFLRLSSKNSVYFLAGIVVAMLIAGVSKGILQGLKRFAKLSYTVIFESAGRVGLAIILVALGLKMAGALGGFLIPLILGYFLTIYFLRDIIKISNIKYQISNSKNQKPKIIEQKIENQQIKEIWKYVFYSFLVFLFLNFLLNMDKILVKHYFSTFEAGVYSSFATLGQAVFLGVTLLTGIMFPLVAFKQARREDYFRSLKIVSLFSFLIGGLGILIFFLFPKEFFLIIFGKKYLGGAPFLGYYSVVMGIFGFIFLLSYFFMALNKFKFLYILAAGSILEILLIILWHSNFFQVILMFSISLIITLLGMGFLICFERRQLSV